MPDSFGFSVSAIAFGDGRFVGAGTNCRGGAQGFAITSTDGVHWIKSSLIIYSELIDVAFGNGTFVGVGSHGCVAHSIDGLSWKGTYFDSRWTFEGVAYGKSTFVNVGSVNTTVGSNRLIVQSGNVAVPSLGELARNENGINFGVAGEIGRVYRVEASPDFGQWSEIGAFTNMAPTMEFLDSTATNVQQRFYRAVLQ